MPKINRVRIVNFSYNNNNRHIIDECFNFYGGENALFSLANGGGKSVLVQAMLQPILPKISLLGRKFRDFFMGKKTPSYIMIEWKLDDEAGYLLSGIAVASRTSHSSDEDDENIDIRFFTFLSEYEESNEFDIKHIPVAEQIGTSVRIASYNDFKKLLQKESVKNQRELFVYDSTREEQNQYDRKLISYGISREEWKELIVNINEAEHGVSEVFSQCKTSRKVMEQWIIKYIEKVLNKSDDSEITDHRKLEMMMAQVAQSLVDNEKHIREYNEIEALNQDLDSIYNDIKTVLMNLDSENKLKKDISEGYAVMINEQQRLEQELVDLENCLRDLTNKLKSIELEKISQEIYKYTEEIEIINKELMDLDENIENQKLLLEEKKYKLDLQKAAEKYSRKLEKEKTIGQLKQRLDIATKDQEKLMSNLNQIKYSLKIAYNKEITKIKKEIDADYTRLNVVLDNIDKIRIEINECQMEIEKLIKRIGGVESEINNFEKKEPETLKILNIQIYRNPLLKELDYQEVIKVKEQLKKDRQEMENLLNEKKNDMDKLKETFASLQQRKEELSRKRIELKVKESEFLTGMKNFQNEKQTVLDALKRLDINADYLYDPVYLLKLAREYLNDWVNKEYNIKMEISELERQIYGIEKGVSYLPASFISLLQENNFPCYTGEQYLREINEETKSRLLDRNPLLPYAIIATEKEIPLIEQLASSMELSQVIPVVRINQKDHEIDLEQQNLHFISSPKNITLTNEDIGNLIKDLVEKKEYKILELEKAIEIINRVNSDYQIIANFKWTMKEVENLENERLVNERAIKTNDEEIKTCDQQINAINRQKEELAAEVEMLKQELPNKENRINNFSDYLAKDAIYTENLRLYSQIQSKINNLTASKKKYEADKARLDEHATELDKELKVRRSNLKDTQDRLKEVEDSSDDVIIDAGVAELEGRMEAYKKQQNNEVTNLNEQIRGLTKDVQDIEKDVRKLKLATDEYKDISYSENDEIELEKMCSKLAKEIETLEEEKIKHDKKITELNVRIEIEKKALGDNPIVPIVEIRGNFSARRSDIDRKRLENESAKEKVHKDKLELAKLLTRIESEIKDIKEILADAIEDIEKPVKIRKSAEEIKSTIDSMLQEYNNTMDNSNKSIDSFRNNSSRFISRYANYEEGTAKEAVKGIQYQIETLDRTYEKYYYLAERVEYYMEQLLQILKIMESKMQQLEHSQKDLTEHAFMEARRIYHEIPKISENSAVEIDGVRKRVLEIQYEEMTDELQARERMSIYIQECLKSLTELIKSDKDENRLRRDIEKYMSTKELLNIISSLENCRIRAYKVDLNEKNRRMLPWEDIIIKNSGGEKFVAYFSLLVALISYSRKQIKGYETFNKKEESKVLIMDNPFGPITSGHLLKPMFDIARKYNTQLICLSDIKQGSVINSFDLIYMIKIRQNMMQEDFLEIEPVLLKELKQDEKLEKAHFYSKFEQVSFL